MSKTVSPDELLDHVASMDVDPPDEVITIGSADIERDVNLNAIAIGLGLEHIEYEPERFPGLIYTLEEYDETVTVLFGNGILFVASAVSVDVQNVVDHVVNQLEELGLVDETVAADVVNSPAEIQVPAEYAQSEEVETSEIQISCPSCGSELAGDENYCPDCGANLSVD